MPQMQRPVLLLLICLLVLSASGTYVLCQPWCTPRDARETEYFLGRVAAECAFDAISATCGCGLNAGSIEQRYSPAGRWVLWSVGVLGALTYLACGAGVICRLAARSRGNGAGGGSAPEAPAWATGLTAPVLTSALILAGALAALVYFAGRAVCPTVSPTESIWLTGSAFFSLGLALHAPDAGTALMLAFVGLIGSLGWTIWLLPFSRIRAALRGVPMGRIAIVYVLGLGAAGGLLCGLEQPRGGESIGKLTVAPEEGAAPLSSEALAPRFVRSLVAATNAATSGIASEPLSERGLRDGSKAALAGLVLLGGFLGGPGGGLTITLLVLAWRSVHGRPVAMRVLAALSGTTIVVALLLLLLEAQVASRFQPPPTFADALLEASSAIGGSGLTSGLTGNLTARNLVSGIGLGLSQYQLGMILLASAMVAGRVLPLALLARFALRRDT